MPMCLRFATAGLACGFVILVNGCGQKLPPHPKTYKVHGKVMLDGSPVVGNELLFVPVTPGPNGLDARSWIGEDGTYNASSYVDQEGMVPGEYKVYVDPQAILPGKPDVKLTQIPDKYRSAESTDLRYTVKAEDNTIDIELK